MKSLDSDPSKHTHDVVFQKQGGIETSAFICSGLAWKGSKLFLIKNNNKEDTNNKIMAAS